MTLNEEDRKWISEQLKKLATKDDLATLKTDLIGEDARLLREIRAYVKKRVSAYHPEEHLAE